MIRLFSRFRGENLDLNSRMAVCIEKWMDLNLTFLMEPRRLADRFNMRNEKWHKLRTPRFWTQVTGV